MSGLSFPIAEGKITMTDKWIYWFDELRSEHNDMVGKKCANLGEMVHLGMRVPPGFAISVDGYEQFMEATGAGAEIREFVQQNQDELINKVEKQIEASRFIRGVIESKPMPADMAHALWNHYGRLCEQTSCEDVPVAARSSGAVSMPGQMETYLNVRGKKDLADKVVRVWGSAFTTRAIAFRLEKGMALDKAPIGVAVLKMINARCAGVTLTVLPVTGDLSKIVVEGNWGLGESVVSGEITPDNFVVDKQSGEIATTIGSKTKMVVYKDAGTRMVSKFPRICRTAPVWPKRKLKKSRGSPKWLKLILTPPRTWSGSLIRTNPFRKISTGFKPGPQNLPRKRKTKTNTWLSS